MAASEQINNRRAGIRVAFPVTVLAVLAEPRQLVASRVEVLARTNNAESLLAQWVQSQRAAGELEDVNPILIEMLLELDRKIERLLSPSAPAPSVTEGQAVNFSSCGMLFQSDQLFPSDSYMRLSFELPVYPHAHIDLIGRVVRSGSCQEPLPEQYRFFNAIEYDTISEQDRDHVIEFVLEKERELIRASKARQGVQ